MRDAFSIPMDDIIRARRHQPSISEHRAADAHFGAPHIEVQPIHIGMDEHDFDEVLAAGFEFLRGKGTRRSEITSQ